MASSKDYIAVAHSNTPFVSVYPWTGMFGTKIANPATPPVGTGYGVAFSPAGNYIAVAYAASPNVSAYPWTDTFGTKIADPATLPANSGFAIAFSPAGNYLAVAHSTTPFISVYPWTGVFGTKVADPATLPSGDGNTVTFSPAGNYIAVAHLNTPFVSVYPWTGTFGTKITNPATLPAGNGNGVAFSPAGDYIAVAHAITPFVSVYPWTGVFGTKVADPATLPTGTGNGVAFSPAGDYIAVAHASTTTPFISVYPWTGTFGTKVADPATLPTGTGLTVKFSPLGDYIAVAHAITPFISVYPWTGTFGTKIANPATLPTGTGNSVTFTSVPSPVAVFCCGFECGQIGTAGQHIYNSGNTAPTISTAIVNSGGGLRSLRCNPSANTSGVIFRQATSLRMVGRFYLYFTTLPNVSVSILMYGDNTSVGPAIVFNVNNSSLFASIGGNGATYGATGVAITAGVWYRIDFDFNVATASNDFCDVQVDGIACGQATAAGSSAATLLGPKFGFFDAAVTADCYYDDVIISQTGADYPIGAGYVLSYVPDADGTHTATGTNIVKGTIATPVGTAITSATTDAFNWVNGRPLLGGATDNTRLINQQTLLTTQYAEVDFEPSAEINAPRAVEVLTADRQAATTVGSFATKLNDNGTEDVIIARTAAAGVITDRYVTKQYATMVGGGAWTLSRFNALKARFGYSGDATPDQDWRGIIIEAEYAVLPLPARPIQMLGQAMNRSGNF